MIGWCITGVSAAASYLVGSIPFGLLVGRAKGVDVRKAGSGNIGATNVSRLLGRKWGFLVFGLDVLKGLVPAVLAGLVLRANAVEPLQLAWLLAGFASVGGHVANPWLGFRGGKGVATSLGVVLGIWPDFTISGLLALLLWVVVVKSSGYVSLASLSAAVAFPLLLLIRWAWVGASIQQNATLLIAGLGMMLVIIYLHRSNIRRLLAGTEPRVGQRREQADSVAT